MALVTLRDAKESRLRQVASACKDSAEFASLVNDATRQLMRRGHWFGTVQKIRGCVYNSCITWPRQVGTVLAMNRCGNHVPVYNNWYQFTPVDRQDCYSAMTLGWRNRNVLVNDGETPVFNQIECDSGMYIRIYPTQPSDVGKTVTLYGVDTNGQTVRSERLDGTFQDGIVLNIAVPYASTQIQFRRITRVLKEVTDGPIRLYQYDSTNDVLKDMAYYESGETSPSYRHTVLSAGRIGWGNCNSGACGSGLKQITALIKLQFIPVVYDDDIVQIENLDALKMAIQAIKAGEAYSHQEAEIGMARAVHEMNLELYDKYPLDQTPVSVNPFGSARPSRSGIGQIV